MDQVSDQVRRGWSRDEEGWWWHHTIRTKSEKWTGATLKVKVTEGVEETLFSLLDDESELQVASVIQYATHMDICGNCDLLDDWLKKLSTVLQTANDPAPCMEALKLCSLGYETRAIVDAITSNKLSNLKSLTILDLYHEGGVEGGLAEMLVRAIDADCLPSLRYLELGGSSCNRVNFPKVMESGRMLALQTLLLHSGLYSGNMWERAWEAYANAISSGYLPFLKCLKLSGIKGIEALGRAIESGNLKKLTELDLSNSANDSDMNQIHDMLAEQMGSGRLPALKRLNLDQTNMTDESCQAYANAIISGQLPSLRSIRFSHNVLGTRAAEALGRAIQSGELKNLVELKLDSNEITNEGITLLAKSIQEGEAGILPNLSFISLFGNAFTGVGLRPMAEALKSGRLDSLQFLKFGKTVYSSLDPESYKEGANALSTFVSAFSSNMNLTVDLDFKWDEFPYLHRRIEQLRKRNLRIKSISAGLAAAPVVPAAFGKVYLCGSPEVGKTTLRRTLQRSRWESLLMRERMPHVEKHTRGIDVSQFLSPSNKQGENPVTLLVWDMAGQDEYHVVHNAFFPDLNYAEGKATSFVVVCGSKDAKNDSKLKNYGEDSKHQVDYWLQQLVYWLKFIASSCGKSTDRRHVFIVLNNFYGELKVSNYRQKWEKGLEILKEDFKDYLNIQTDAFIMDVRKYSFVRPLKRRLLEHSRSLLKGEMIPDICQFIQKNLTHWTERMEQFPVLQWTDFVKKVHQSSSEPWPVETLETATKYLNEAGVLIYIDRNPPLDCQMDNQKLVVLNPTWFSREIVGNIFLRQDMGHPTDILFRMKVNKSKGSISESEFKNFFKLLLGTANEWSDKDLADLIAILLWLGLCYKGRGQKLFIPSLIAENVTPWDHWESGSSREHGEDQWVMGFSVEHSKSKATLAPMALWHRFQVELAQTSKFNGHPDNDFVTGKYFIKFCADYMSVLIEVNVERDSPTFNDISIFVKPLRKVEDLDGNRRKQFQVDLASDLVEILLGLWIEVCPGVEYLHRVVWPWPASQSRREVLSERNVEVAEVRRWVQEHGLGRSLQWMVGSCTIKEDQLLATKDKKYVVQKYQELVHDTLHMLRQFEREAVDEGICPASVVTVEVQCEVSTLAVEQTDIVSLPKSASSKLLLRKLESMEKKIVKQLDNIEGLVREEFKEVLKKERELLGKLQDTGEFILQDRERICPRFIYLGEKDSGAWMTLKDALSLKKKTRLRFLCEARFDDYRQHAVKHQQGLDMPELKDWAKTIAPWLKVSLAVIFISAKVAANVVLPGVGLILPEFTQWQQASSLSDGIALATAFSKEDLNQLVMEGMGLDVNDTYQNPRLLNGKSRKALSEFLGKLTLDEYEKKLGLRKVRLSYDDGSQGVVWICTECFDKYASMKVVTELPI